jgi:hypothetical protein
MVNQDQADRGAGGARTGDEGDGVFAAKLGGLEDVLVDRGEGWRLSVDHACARRVREGGRVLRAASEGPVHGAAGFTPRRSVCHAVSQRVVQVAVQWARRGSAHTWAVFWELLDSIVRGWVGVWRRGRGRERFAKPSCSSGRPMATLGTAISSMPRQQSRAAQESNDTSRMQASTLVVFETLVSRHDGCSVCSFQHAHVHVQIRACSCHSHIWHVNGPCARQYELQRDCVRRAQL